jgi:hypothetical protein
VQALQFHGFNAALWVKAAKWEWETNANVSAARALMQRGLRLNPASPLLWHEYFRLELLHLDKIVKRRKILGIHNPEDTRATRRPDEAEAGPAAKRTPTAAHAGQGGSDDEHLDAEEAAYSDVVDSDEDDGPGGRADFNRLVNGPLPPSDDDRPPLEVWVWIGLWVREGFHSPACVFTSQLPKDKDMFLAGLIPQLVAKQAAGEWLHRVGWRAAGRSRTVLAALPEDVALLAGFLDIYRLFSDTEASRAAVYDRWDLRVLGLFWGFVFLPCQMHC